MDWRERLKDPEFTLWAFGTTDGTTRLDATPPLWNARHSDLFDCDPASNVKVTIERMYKAFLDEKACK